MVTTVFGATGFIGSHTAEQLRMQGHAVRTPVRKGSDPSFLRALGCEIIEIDFARDEEIRSAVVEGGMVYNCIAAGNAMLEEADIRSVEVDLTQRIIRLAKEKGAAGYIQLSSIISYGHQIPADGIDEDYGQTPAFFLDKIALEREQVVRETCHKVGLSFVILQPVSTIGKRARGNAFSRLIDSHKQGEFPLVSGGYARVSLVDTRDIGRCMVWLGEHIERVSGQSLLLKGFDTTWSELKQVLDRLRGKTEQAKHYPFWLLYGLGAVLERWQRDPRVSRRIAYILGRDKVYHDARIREAGFSPCYTLEDAVAQIL